MSHQTFVSLIEKPTSSRSIYTVHFKRLFHYATVWLEHVATERQIFAKTQHIWAGQLYTVQRLFSVCSIVPYNSHDPEGLSLRWVWWLLRSTHIQRAWQNEDLQRLLFIFFFCTCHFSLSLHSAFCYSCFFSLFVLSGLSPFSSPLLRWSLC